jgi:hypothetical protein
MVEGNTEECLLLGLRSGKAFSVPSPSLLSCKESTVCAVLGCLLLGENILSRNHWLGASEPCTSCTPSAPLKGRRRPQKRAGFLEQRAQSRLGLEDSGLARAGREEQPELPDKNRSRSE